MLFLNYENYHKWCKTGKNWFISQLFMHLLKCPNFDIQIDDRRNLICIVQMLSRKLFLCTLVCQIFFWLPNHNIWTGLFYDWLRYSMSSEFQFHLPSDKLVCKSTLMCNEDVLSFSIFVFREKRIHPLKAKCRLVDNRYDCRLFKTCQGSTWLKILRCLCT